MSYGAAQFLTLVGNLDPSREDQITKVFEPKGFCPVARSRNFVAIISRVLMGAHEEVISAWLLKEKNESISGMAIRDYVLQHVPPDLTRPNLQLEYIRKSQSYSELEQIELCQKVALSRLSLLLDGPVPIEPTTQLDYVLKVIDITRKLAETSFEMRIKTGQIAKAPEKVEVDVRQTTMLDLVDGRQIEMDDRRAADLHHALHRLGVLKRLEGKTEQSDADEDEEAVVVSAH